VARAVLRSGVTITLLFALYALAPVGYVTAATAAGTHIRLVGVVVIVALVVAV
jgi:hypothetical protein